MIRNTEYEVNCLYRVNTVFRELSFTSCRKSMRINEGLFGMVQASSGFDEWGDDSFVTVCCYSTVVWVFTDSLMLYNIENRSTQID